MRNPERKSKASGVHQRVVSIVARGAGAHLADERFDEIALAVYRHQFELNAPYRVYCQARGATPERVSALREIPAVPTDAFKAAALLCGDPHDAAEVFRTSGTTGGPERRGVHYFLDANIYRAALRAGFSAHLLRGAANLPILSLVPPPDELPDSSLSFMIGDVLSTFGAKGSGCFVSAAGIDLPSFVLACERAVEMNLPVLLAGTSLAFVHLLEALRARRRSFRLPAGSRLMDTGGFKGRSRQIGRADFFSMVDESLGIPAPWVVNEYGMTEMSSQFYDAVAGEGSAEAAERRHRGPAWVRSVAVDPETLEPLPEGELGILRHFDLANVDSVAALQTADLGLVRAGEIELIGRAQGSAVRGCSIAMDELLDALGRA